MQRLSLDNESACRALAKDVGEGPKQYGHGESENWLAFSDNVMGPKLVLRCVRLDLGVRQDKKTEAAMVAYWNRPCWVEYLKSAYYRPPFLLRDSCYVTMTCLEFIAGMRVLAVFHDK
jgi:hypothetical protein